MTMRQLIGLVIIAPPAVVHYVFVGTLWTLSLAVGLALHAGAWILVPLLRATGWGIDSPSLDRRQE